MIVARVPKRKGQRSASPWQRESSSPTSSALIRSSVLYRLMFPFNMFPMGRSRPFRATYESYPVALLSGNEREDVERGGKIIMPPSALQVLSTSSVSYPMIFKLVNPKMGRTTHCGVLEFVADEGRVYLPLWMMENLMLEEGDPVQLENVLLPVATFSRFQPQSPDFLDISNPKAVLENLLRHFACLSAGDIINLKYNDKDYQLSVLETQPSDAVSIIECDMNVDFAPPIGYVEPTIAKSHTESAESVPDDPDPNQGFVAFGGAGNRLDGKPNRKRTVDLDRPKTPVPHGVPDYSWKLGTIAFIRNVHNDSTKGQSNGSKLLSPSNRFG